MGAAGSSRTKGKVAILAENDYQDQELWVPLYRLREEGYETEVIGPQAGRYTSKYGYPVQATRAASQARAGDYLGVVIPGGWAPDKLRRYKAVTDLVRAMNDTDKPLAIICHGGLIAISAGIVKGRRATGSLGIKDDLVNAGATWVDNAAFRDGNLVWGRVVADIPAFCRELVAALVDVSGA